MLQASNVFVNGTGQAAVLAAIPKLIDPKTPDKAMTRIGFDGEEYKLVFSDEFEVDGRSFYPGDDPFWEAVDCASLVLPSRSRADCGIVNYWQTGDLEWYDPAAITTRNGSLEITLSIAQPRNNHGLVYRSGMLSTWNKMCFTVGFVWVCVLRLADDEVRTDL